MADKTAKILSSPAWSGSGFSRRAFGEMKRLAGEVRAKAGGSVNIMEVCGTHTMAIAASGMRSMLPENVRMLSGPGCPVCVTSQGDIDRILKAAWRAGVVMATFGDMMKVKGTDGGNLHRARAKGKRVEVVYSPLDALKLAEREKEKKIIFAGVGFETTAPLIAQTVLTAEKRGINNFFVLPLFKLVPPALQALLSDKTSDISGFILPGHVSVVLGSGAYDFLNRRVPSVIAGFEPMDIVCAVNMILRQRKENRAEVETEYFRAVKPRGNETALSVMNRVFKTCDAVWRAVGKIPGSGLAFRKEFERFDAFKEFDLPYAETPEPEGCLCGRIIMGRALPPDCPLFAKACTPSDAVGPCMVSTEGACAAWFKYGDAKLKVKR